MSDNDKALDAINSRNASEEIARLAEKQRQREEHDRLRTATAKQSAAVASRLRQILPQKFSELRDSARASDWKKWQIEDVIVGQTHEKYFWFLRRTVDVHRDVALYLIINPWSTLSAVYLTADGDIVRSDWVGSPSGHTSLEYRLDENGFENLTDIEILGISEYLHISA